MYAENYKRIKNTTRYYISNCGSIFVRLGKYNYRPLAVTRNLVTGYLYVNMQLRSGEYRVDTVHRLVAEHFVPKPKYVRHLEINHKDGNKENNTANNLEWVTHADNLKHGWRSGQFRNVQPAIIKKKVELNGKRSALTDDDVRQIRRLKNEGFTNHELGYLYQLHPMQISRICNRRSFASVD